MSKKITVKQVSEIITEYAKQDLEDALKLISGHFVGLHVAYVTLSPEAEDGAEKNKIEITNKSGRNITIHAEK